MITDKAWKLREEYITREDENWGSSVLLSDAAFQELIDNCHPTKAEFEKFAFRLWMTPGVMWELTMKIPEWDTRTPGITT